MIAFDVALCLVVVAAALCAVAGRDLFASVMFFIVYGVLVAVAWVRLDAVDVALAEAAIGAGLTGVLLIGAVSRLGAAATPAERPPGGALAQGLRLALCLAVTAGLAAVVLTLPDSAGLRPLAMAHLLETGVSNPVTAVLLNYRAYDTLLETVVLAVALIAVWSLTPDRLWGRAPGLPQRVRPDGVLASFGRVLPPIGLLVGIYLVWIGSSAPGGAFQGGTILAAVWLLAIMAGLTQPAPVTSAGLRVAVAAGPVVFLAVGTAGIAFGVFLGIPTAWAKTLILAIEAFLAASIAVTLALLVAGPPRLPAAP